ncbi:unnamed protein product [Ambrosiozyma monospora]|uniref:Unnamed protein product n=1 Tax=Ambrosiozyma monospora TaxID=43982 RepID=A0A9W6Z0D2_AMBMO|nr:unnamed protein product [Ambrosiozyma monospora]
MLDKFKDDQLKQKNYIQKHGLVAVKPLMAIPSGLCVITKGKPLSEKFDIEKSTFLTKVKGQFPDSGNQSCKDDVIWFNRHTKSFQFKTDVPESQFQLVKFDPELNESVVQITANDFPKSEFLTQIRVHLRNLGFPMVNDLVFGEGGSLAKVVKNQSELTPGQWNQYALEVSSRVESDEASGILNQFTGCTECGQPNVVSLVNDVPLLPVHLWRLNLASSPDGVPNEFKAPLPDWAS